MPGASGGRRILLAIGVANAKPLEWLPGAANAARDIGDWGRCSNFDAVSVLTDEKSIGQTRWTLGDPSPRPIDRGTDLAVTIARIGEEIGILLPPGEATEWFVLHFAGHGLRQDSTRTFWLPSDWESANRAIAVEALKTSLECYGIDNLTIISDACRDFANRPATANLNPDGILGRGPVQPVQPALDRFNAVEDGKPAYMVPGETQQDARCILSGTISNALWGHESKAFDKHETDRVLSGSLLDFIGVETKAIGERYGLETKAEAFRNYNGSPQLIYFDLANPPNPAAPPIIWPTPKPDLVSPDLLAGSAIAAAADRLEPVVPSEIVVGIAPDEMLGSLKGGFDLAFAIERESEPGLTSKRRRVRAWRTEVAEETVKRGLEVLARKTEQSAIRTALREGQRRPSEQANLILRGGNPVRIWSPFGARRIGRKKSWIVDVKREASVQIIVEYDDRVFAPMVVYEKLDTVASYEGDGRVTGWMCVPRDAAGTANLSTTTDAISRLQTSQISPAKVDEVAAEIRQGKHLNPMLGAIAAYLYDYIGDRDNIRRMAYYYANFGQPIPYDIAFLGMFETHFDQHHRLIARIPAVTERRPDPNRPGLPEFATRATKARNGEVAGRCPWLRQGWDYVAAPADVEKAMTVHLQRALGELLNSSFTALAEPGGRGLIQDWQLEEDQ